MIVSPVAVLATALMTPPVDSALIGSPIARAVLAAAFLVSVTYKVRMDAVAKALDFRGLYYNDGVT